MKNVINISKTLTNALNFRELKDKSQENPD